MQHDQLSATFVQVRDVALRLLSAHPDMGKNRPALAIGCTSGQHRTVAVAEFRVKALAEGGCWVSTHPRELERRRQITAPERE